MTPVAELPAPAQSDTQLTYVRRPPATGPLLFLDLRGSYRGGATTCPTSRMSTKQESAAAARRPLLHTYGGSTRPR